VGPSGPLLLEDIMKYKYMPNCSIVDYENLKVKFRFDENGEFETEDMKLIEWIRKNKNFLKPIEEEKRLPADGLYNCKKCSYSTTNKGELMRHYKHEHPK
jgi:hypothetical protein